MERTRTEEYNTVRKRGERKTEKTETERERTQ